MPTANDNGLTDQAYFCPGCGSAVINASALGGEAECRACGWKGSAEQLAAVPFGQQHGDQAQILQAMFNDVRALFAKETAKELILLLRKWGFIDERLDRKQIIRYFGGISKAIVKGLIETREEIEKEKVR